jgi:hypothetical protein
LGSDSLNVAGGGSQQLDLLQQLSLSVIGWLLFSVFIFKSYSELLFLHLS